MSALTAELSPPEGASAPWLKVIITRLLLSLLVRVTPILEVAPGFEVIPTRASIIIMITVFRFQCIERCVELGNCG
jgi:hypothetical protein